MFIPAQGLKVLDGINDSVDIFLALQQGDLLKKSTNN